MKNKLKIALIILVRFFIASFMERIEAMELETRELPTLPIIYATPDFIDSFFFDQYISELKEKCLTAIQNQNSREITRFLIDKFIKNNSNFSLKPEFETLIKETIFSFDKSNKEAETKQKISVMLTFSLIHGCIVNEKKQKLRSFFEILHRETNENEKYIREMEEYWQSLTKLPTGCGQYITTLLTEIGILPYFNPLYNNISRQVADYAIVNS